MFLIIINFENSYAASYICENRDNFFPRFFEEQKIQKNSIYLL